MVYCVWGNGGSIFILGGVVGDVKTFLNLEWIVGGDQGGGGGNGWVPF